MYKRQHLLYGENLLGNVGKIWMAFVAALALISSQNSAINGLASICQGMAKMNMMPRCFKKLNKNNVPFVGVWFISILILVFAFISSEDVYKRQLQPSVFTREPESLAQSLLQVRMCSRSRRSKEKPDV